MLVSCEQLLTKIWLKIIEFERLQETISSEQKQPIQMAKE